MRNLIVASIVMLMSLNVSAQKYFTKTGKTAFKASVEAFEPVAAESNSTTAILNTANGEVAALIFVKTFHFKVALMEEHFNENYMDSDKHPKAKFKGKIQGFDIDKLTAEGSDFPLKGTLVVKGKKKAIDTTINLKMVDGKVLVNGGFEVKPEEFGIDIPGVVRNKIAKSIKITLDYELVKK